MRLFYEIFTVSIIKKKNHIETIFRLNQDFIIKYLSILKSQIFNVLLILRSKYYNQKKFKKRYYERILKKQKKFQFLLHEYSNINSIITTI